MKKSNRKTPLECWFIRATLTMGLGIGLMFSMKMGKFIAGKKKEFNSTLIFSFQLRFGFRHFAHSRV